MQLTNIYALDLGQALQLTQSQIQGEIPQVNNNELEDAVVWMFEQWLTKFDTVTAFEPNGTLTREAASKFIGVFAVNTLKLQEDKQKNTCEFSDNATAHQWLLPSIMQACYMGLFKGSDGKFLPKQNLTNGQALTVLMKSVLGESPDTVWWDHFSDIYRNAAKDWWLDMNSNIARSSSSMRDAAATRGDIAIFMYRVWKQYNQK